MNFSQNYKKNCNLIILINIISEFINSSSSKYLGVIDLTNNWDDKYLSDNIHYSELGAEHVANIYYNELKKIKLNKNKNLD